MEKNEFIPNVVENDEDLLIDLGAASVETRGADVVQVEDEGRPADAFIAE